MNGKCRTIADPLRVITERMLCFYVHVMDVITGGELQVVVVFFSFKTSIHLNLMWDQRAYTHTHTSVHTHIHIWSRLWKCISTGMFSRGGMMGCFLWWISTRGDWPLLRSLYIKLCVAAEEMAAKVCKLVIQKVDSYTILQFIQTNKQTITFNLYIPSLRQGTHTVSSLVSWLCNADSLNNWLYCEVFLFRNTPCSFKSRLSCAVTLVGKIKSERSCRFKQSAALFFQKAKKL